MRRFLLSGAITVGAAATMLVTLVLGTANAAQADTSSIVTTAAPVGAVAQIQNCDGRVEQFTVGSDHHLYHRWQTTAGGSWSSWASLGGYLISNVAGVRNVNCRLEMFGVAPGNAMWHIWQDNPGQGPWSNWASLGGFLTSGPSTGFLSGGRAYVTALGSDNRSWCDAQSAPGSGPWTGWYHC